MRNPSRVSSRAEASTGAQASSSTPKIRLGNLVASTLYVTLVPCIPEASVEGSALEADYSQNWRHPTLNSGRTGADGLGILRRTAHITVIPITALVAPHLAYVNNAKSGDKTEYSEGFR